MNQHERDLIMYDATIRVFPEIGQDYLVTLTLDTRLDPEEQINVWMDDNLINVQDWRWN